MIKLLIKVSHFHPYFLVSLLIFFVFIPAHMFSLFIFTSPHIFHLILPLFDLPNASINALVLYIIHKYIAGILACKDYFNSLEPTST
jgi:hypothetical protein